MKIISLLFLLLSANLIIAQTKVCFKNVNGDAVKNITMQYEVRTDNGNFSLDAQAEGDCYILNYDGLDQDEIQSVKLLPFKRSSSKSGVSIFDHVGARKLILAIPNEPETNLQNFVRGIASDVNLNSGVTTFDLVLSARFIIGSNLSNEMYLWKFFDWNQVQEYTSSSNYPGSLGYQQSNFDLIFDKTEILNPIQILSIRNGDINGDSDLD